MSLKSGLYIWLFYTVAFQSRVRLMIVTLLYYPLWLQHVTIVKGCLYPGEMKIYEEQPALAWSSAAVGTQALQPLGMQDASYGRASPHAETILLPS